MLAVRGAIEELDQILVDHSTHLSRPAGPAARIGQPPDPNEVRRAKQDVAQARTAVQLAEVEQTRARFGASGSQRCLGAGIGDRSR
jgi:hypothetical protein